MTHSVQQTEQFISMDSKVLITTKGDAITKGFLTELWTSAADMFIFGMVRAGLSNSVEVGSATAIYAAFIIGFTRLALTFYGLSNCGGLINPLVTLAFFIAKFGRQETGAGPAVIYSGLYIFAQFIGSGIGALALLAVLGVGNPLGTPIVTEIALWQGWFFQVIISTIFTICSLHAFIYANYSFMGFSGTSLYMGTLTTALTALSYKMLGGLLDPFRWFFPAIFSLTWNDGWVFATAPILGMFIGLVILALISIVSPDNGNEGRHFGLAERNVKRDA